MESKNASIYVTSVNNMSKQLEHYGTANMMNICLLKLLYKYSCYCSTYDQIQRMDSMVAELQRTDRNICLEFQAARGADYTNPVGVVDISAGANTAPTLSDSSFTLEDPNLTYTFSYSDLFSGYSDAEGGDATNFEIKTLPVAGVLHYDGVAVEVGSWLSDPSLLTYTRIGTGGYATSFTYTAYDDDNQLQLESNVATCNGTIDSIVSTNEPATVGDRAQYSGNRTTTVFSSTDFTTETIAPYFDPENNELDAIRIDEISTANEGAYYYYDALVVEGQVITKAELDAGAFYHVAADSNAVSTDSFNASARDTGSMIWVQ